MTDELKEYRDLLIAAEQKAQEDFDKTVLTLSGGALGISFAFIKDIVGDEPITHVNFLLCSWVAWGISMMSMLMSFYSSQIALRKTISQLDDGSIYQQSPGGWYSQLTAVLNALGAIFFIVGVILIIIFASYNLR